MLRVSLIVLLAVSSSGCPTGQRSTDLVSTGAETARAVGERTRSTQDAGETGADDENSEYKRPETASTDAGRARDAGVDSVAVQMAGGPENVDAGGPDDRDTSEYERPK